MPWTNWYAENFDSAPTGKIVGYDGWKYAGITNNPNNAIESGYISPKYAVSGNALSCETAKPTTGSVSHYEHFSRGLGTGHYDYETQFDIQYFAPLPPPTGVPGITVRTINVRGLRGNSLQVSWFLQFDFRNRVTLQVPSVGSKTSGIIDFVSAPQTVRVREDADGLVSLYFPGISASAILTANAPKTPTYRGMDRLSIMLNSSSTIPLNAAIDNILVRYWLPSLPTTPKAPQNVFVNSRENYSVLSWDAVNGGIVLEDIARPVSGMVDGLANTGLSVSPVITSAIIGAKTVKVAGDLPKEGHDFDTNRAAGTITWRSGATIKVPDPSTLYQVRYEIPINNVAKYNIYRSGLLNEYDQTLYKAVTGLDFGGTLDTAFVDTGPGDVAVYRVASVNADMVESELSDKVIAIKVSTQADDKTESIDRKLFTLDQSLLDEEIIR